VTTGQASALESARHDAGPDLEAVFRLHYSRITKLIVRITRDPGRAEELAVEVFLRWKANRTYDDRAVTGWLSRTAVHLALDEVRRQDRRGRLVHVEASRPVQRNPEEIYHSEDQRARVVAVLSRLKARDADILTLRAQGMPNDELAELLSINPASIGKLVSRAQHAFRKEYLKRYGKAD
jgi:RNA polymerase sigma-70 factor (ECF subfamily)